MIDGATYLPLAKGFLLGASICMTLGPQSAFVLRQGVLRQRAFCVAMICTLADFMLIALAAAGATHLQLTVREDNAAARSLYVSLDFVEEWILCPWRKGF